MRTSREAGGGIQLGGKGPGKSQEKKIGTREGNAEKGCLADEEKEDIPSTGGVETEEGGENQNAINENGTEKEKTSSIKSKSQELLHKARKFLKA